MKGWKLAMLIIAANVLTLRGQTKKPNIVFILADDLGWGELNCYGNTFNETPHLDRLAGQGTRFTQAYAAAPNCSPTRASIMTGQYPARVGITDFLPDGSKTPRYLDPAKFITLNEALSGAGYHTGIIGKWHLDTHFLHPKGMPKDHGFDEVIGSETKYIADGDYFFPYDKINTFTEGKENEYLTDRQCSEAVSFIKRNKDRPFFLYLSFYSVHAKLAAPAALVEKYKKKFDARYGAGEAERIYEKRHEGPHKDNPYLAAMLESMDTGVGRVLQTLDESGLAENTLVVFFSDNGGAGPGANNGNLKGSKMWIYEGGIREPLIMRWPGRIKASVTETRPVCSVDFYPTFLDIAGSAASPGQVLDGVDLMPLFKGGKFSRDELFWHYPSETARSAEKMAGAVRKGNFKLLQFYKDNHVELYDLDKDPGETDNLAAQMPGKAAELTQLLGAWKKRVNAEAPVITAGAGRNEE